LATSAESDGPLFVDVNLTKIEYVQDPDLCMGTTYYDLSGLAREDWEAFRPHLEVGSRDFLAEAIIAGVLHRRGHSKWRASRGAGAILAKIARIWGYETDDGQVCYKYSGLAEEILLEAGLDLLVSEADKWLASNPEPPAPSVKLSVSPRTITQKRAAGLAELSPSQMCRLLNGPYSHLRSGDGVDLAALFAEIETSEWKQERRKRKRRRVQPDWSSEEDKAGTDDHHAAEGEQEVQPDWSSGEDQAEEDNPLPGSPERMQQLAKTIEARKECSYYWDDEKSPG